MPISAVESSKTPGIAETLRASKSDIPRRVERMKYQYQRGGLRESKVQSVWDNVGDTDLGHIDIQDFRSRVCSPNAYGRLRQMMESGIAQAAGFPPAVQNYELVVEAARHYQPGSRLVLLEDMVLANFTPEAISDAFDIPFPNNPTTTTIDEAQGAYDMNPARCKTLINEEWYKERRPPSVRIGKKTPRSDFHNEHGDMVTLLSRVMGLPKSNYFEEWMFYFIEQVFAGKSKFDWAHIISDNIHTQLIELETKKYFTMTSYLVYMFAKNQPLPGLIMKGEIGNGPGQVKVSDCYPQLHY